MAHFYGRQPQTGPILQRLAASEVFVLVEAMPGEDPMALDRVMAPAEGLRAHGWSHETISLAGASRNQAWRMIGERIAMQSAGVAL